MKIAHRSNYPHLLDALKLKVGVEVGVQYGLFSDHILHHSSIDTLYSVDPWMMFSQEDYQDMGNVTQREQDSRYLYAVTQLRRHQYRSVIVRRTSEEAATILADHMMDFVYIDANHSYEQCRHDLELWWPKLRPGGLFSGHDYVDGKFSAGDFGVKSAVDEFVGREQLKLYVTDEEWPTWYALKGG